MVRLKRRSEFLSVAATGRRWTAPAFVLQVGPREGRQDAASGEIGLGFTATKRIGNAVARNRAKRRLREAARSVLPEAAVAGHDYVVIARADVLTCAFQTLVQDLEKAFSRVLTAKPRAPGPWRRKAGPRPARSPSPHAG
ncbi:MAG: ribonuclease P protein component [Alphaproteobacteria bacterium]